MPEFLAFELTEAARRDCRAADADARRDKRLLGIVRNRVLVDGDMRARQRGFSVLARDALGAEIQQEHVRVGAARNDAKPALLQYFRQNTRVLENALLIDHEIAGHRLAKCRGFGGDDVHQRTALDPRKDR